MDFDRADTNKPWNGVSNLGLILYHAEYFDEWWDADVFDFGHYFKDLAKYCSAYFEVWWDADQFNWEDNSRDLAKYCSAYFEVWWDADQFNWEDNSKDLVKYCSDHFGKWWDVDKIELEKNFKNLAQHSSAYFEIWWNADQINWEDNSRDLVKYCSDHFEVWWDADQFNWEENSKDLVKYCSAYFDKWWNPKELDWGTAYEELLLIDNVSWRSGFRKSYPRLGDFLDTIKLKRDPEFWEKLNDFVVFVYNHLPLLNKKCEVLKDYKAQFLKHFNENHVGDKENDIHSKYETKRCHESIKSLGTNIKKSRVKKKQYFDNTKRFSVNPRGGRHASRNGTRFKS